MKRNENSGHAQNLKKKNVICGSREIENHMEKSWC